MKMLREAGSVDVGASTTSSATTLNMKEEEELVSSQNKKCTILSQSSLCCTSSSSTRSSITSSSSSSSSFLPSSESVTTTASTASGSSSASSTMTTTVLLSHPDATKTTRRRTTPVEDTIVCKPFFVMDFLEEIKEEDLELARTMLQTPKKSKTPQKRNNNNNSISILSLISPIMAVTTTTPTTKTKTQTTSGTRRQRKLQDTQDDEEKEEEEYSLSVCRRELYPPTVATDPTFQQQQPCRRHQRQLDSREETETQYGSEEDLQTLTRNALSASALSITTSPRSTPSKEGSSGSRNTPPLTPTPTPPPTTTTTNDANAKASPNTPTTRMSPFKKKSIAIGNGWNAKGISKAKIGQWDKALACWENALEIRTQIYDNHHHHPLDYEQQQQQQPKEIPHVDIANTCNNIGIALGKLNRYEESLHYLQRALQIRTQYFKTTIHTDVAATLHNIGNVLHQKKDFKQALEQLYESKHILQELIVCKKKNSTTTTTKDNNTTTTTTNSTDHYEIQIARVCVTIGNIYYESNDFDDALISYNDALFIFQKLNNTKEEETNNHHRSEMDGIRKNIQLCLTIKNKQTQTAKELVEDIDDEDDDDNEEEEDGNHDEDDEEEGDDNEINEVQEK